MKFRTTSAYISGALCGSIWWPVGAKCGVPIRVDIDREMRRFSAPASFRDLLQHIVCERGGDFQNAMFTADTTIRVERRAIDAPGKYRVHVWERELSALPDCADYVDQDCYSSDFMGED